MSAGEVKVLEEKWDYLIILDACRYDYFKRVYKDFFDSDNFSEKISMGGCTPDWLKRNFDRKSDTVYITGNPKVSSTKRVDGFDAKRYFLKVYDVWHTHWNQELYAVEPKVLTKQAIKITKQHPGKKAVIHYMQPHEPYLTYEGKKLRKKSKEKPVLRFIYNCISKLLTILRMYNMVLRWRISEILRLEVFSQMYYILQDLGDEGLKKYYEENLRLALSSVRDLVQNLDGLIVITSDHGEMLGENGVYGHWPGAKEPKLRQVPWLVIDKPKKNIDLSSEVEEQEPQAPKATDEEIKEKLRHLGYL